MAELKDKEDVTLNTSTVNVFQGVSPKQFRAGIELVVVTLIMLTILVLYSLGQTYWWLAIAALVLYALESLSFTLLFRVKSGESNKLLSKLKALRHKE